MKCIVSLLPLRASGHTRQSVSIVRLIEDVPGVLGNREIFSFILRGISTINGDTGKTVWVILEFI